MEKEKMKEKKRPTLLLSSCFIRQKPYDLITSLKVLLLKLPQ
jgi:hypothetical protein